MKLLFMFLFFVLIVVCSVTFLFALANALDIIRMVRIGQWRGIFKKEHWKIYIAGLLAIPASMFLAHVLLSPVGDDYFKEKLLANQNECFLDSMTGDAHKVSRFGIYFWERYCKESPEPSISETKRNERNQMKGWR